MIIVYNFFFQAEDGIRDYKVTGVQTCALPISWVVSLPRIRPPRPPRPWDAMTMTSHLAERAVRRIACHGWPAVTHRSEERRVGKECGDRRSPNEWTKERTASFKKSDRETEPDR